MARSHGLLFVLPLFPVSLNTVYCVVSSDSDCHESEELRGIKVQDKLIAPPGRGG